MLHKRLLGLSLFTALSLCVAGCDSTSSTSSGACPADAAVNRDASVDDSVNALACDAFRVGATIDVQAVAAGDKRAGAFAQAAADMAAATAAQVVQLTNACSNIAIDLGAPKAEQDQAASQSGADAMKLWCQLAAKHIGMTKGAASVRVDFTAPVCETLFVSKASCVNKCDPQAKCNETANPPKCEGGRHEIACKGGCRADSGSAGVACDGACEGICQSGCTANGAPIECAGSCSGSCTAPAGVECRGSCSGTCEGTTDPSGRCIGVCKGTCSTVLAGAPCLGMCAGTCGAQPSGVSCQGLCRGTCKGVCKASPAIPSVRCDGKCDSDFESIKCVGGAFKGSCAVDAKCEASCAASALVKSVCPLVPVGIEISPGTSINFERFRSTLQANLPILLVVLKARGQGFVDTAASLSANVAATSDLKPACIVPVAASLTASVQEATTSIVAAQTVAVAAGVQ